MTKCGGKNVFNDISTCGSLPLDSAFNNYNMKGGTTNHSVMGSGKALLNDMVTDGGVLVNDNGSNPLHKVKSLIGGGRHKTNQNGGRESNGYYLGVGKNDIGGLSTVVPYSTCNAPVFNTSCRDLRGGKTRSHRSKKKRSRYMNKRRTRTMTRNKRRKSKSRYRNKNRRRTSSMTRSRRRRTTSRSKNRRIKSRSKTRRHKRHRGGGVDPYNLSGLPSNFSPDMTTRQFGCKTPYWQTKCV